MGGTCGQQRADLIVIDGNFAAHRYINRFLRPVLLPFLHHQPRLLFQQDNARPRTVRVVQQFFATNDISVVLWPARSPDPSPIILGSVQGSVGTCTEAGVKGNT